MSAILIGVAASCAVLRPSWHVPAAINYATLNDDKAALVALYDRASAALNRRLPAVIEIDEALLNRAIAAHDEFWPELRELFAGLRDVRVRMHDGGEIEVAAVPTQLDLPVLAVLGARFSVDSRLRADLTHVGIGRLQIPGSLLWSRLRDSLALERLNRVAVDERGLAIFNEWVWENGRVLFRVSRIEVSAGKLSLELTPIPSSPS